MFDSILFHSNPYFGHSATFFDSVSILCEFSILPNVYLFFLSEQMDISDNTFIKKINLLYVIILVCLGNT